MRRVVVTGMGLVSPLGSGVNFVWKQLIEGKSGLRHLSGFETQDLACRVGGQIPLGEGEGLLNLDHVMPPKDQRKADRFILYAMAAADEALKDAAWAPETEEEKEKTGVLVGSGIGGLPEIYQTSVVLKDSGPRRVSPFFIPACLVNLATGHISIRHQLKGPSLSVVTACASGSHAIGDGARLIQTGEADVMVVGGTEAAICRIGVAGFAAIRALSTSFNDSPEASSRPWDKNRDGFVMGEGAGILVLEEYEHAKKRGAPLYGELLGYGLSGDAYHITAPAEDGDGAFRSMRNALKRAKISPEAIGYVNAHGTSTPMGDSIELRAVERLFGQAAKDLSMSSTKSATGHLLGGAGGVEAIFSLLALRDHCLPPTLNLDEPEETVIDLVPHKAREKKIDFVLSNSFGFGGTNASLIFKRV
ncbi:MAG: beta-ketoacyl-ACP synthase II [Holosporales bacterium]|nr:beta-ketoacyl-ACP synthase II [Holosporales bacterium]